MPHPFIQHLVQDHEEQRKLGQKLKEAKGAKERQKLRQQFYEALLPHMEGEEASIFDYMQAAGGKAREEAMNAVQEHHVAKLVLRELMSLSPEGDVFSAKAYVLDELNRHHMEEEETTHFPMLEKMASGAKIDELYKQYQEAEEAAKKK